MLQKLHIEYVFAYRLPVVLILTLTLSLDVYHTESLHVFNYYLFF